MEAESWALQLEHGLMALERFMETRHNYIAPMAWEHALRAPLGISVDQLRFVLALFASLPIGAGVRVIKSPTGERWRRVLMCNDTCVCECGSLAKVVCVMGAAT